MNRGITVLQTVALPLGYDTILNFAFQPVYYSRHFFVCQGFFGFSFCFSTNGEKLPFLLSLLSSLLSAKVTVRERKVKSEERIVKRTKTKATLSCDFCFWSGLRGSNPPPQPWQGCALPNELNPHMVPPVGIEPTTRRFSVSCSTN